MVLTGTNVVLGKVINAEVPVDIFMLFRFGVSTAALLALVHREASPELWKMTWGQLRDLVFMALFGMIGITALMLEGLRRTSAVDAGIITATLPAVAALLGVVVMRERPQAAAVGIAVTGLFLVETTGAARGTATLLGNLLVMGAVACKASFVILGKRLAPSRACRAG